MSENQDVSFADLGISPWLIDTLQALAIFKPTDVQKGVIPPILKGHDCIGGAKTGSGKTAAFALPILESWSRDPSGIYAVILTPTRELAIQIDEQFAALGSNMSLKHTLIVGGMDMIAQAIALSRRPHVVVATPGRLADLIRSNGPETTAGLQRVKFLVMDEADRLLSSTFADDLGDCFSSLPPSENRQTLLFTATITDAIRQLKEKPTKGNKPPLCLYEIESDKISVPSTLQQDYVFVASHVREAYLVHLLSIPENAEKSVIIFVNRTHTAELIYSMLRLLEFRSTELHSQMAQRERINSLGRFRAEVARILVATDVASRGLDIPSVQLIINYDLPRDPDDYIHRVGRTARAGRSGQAISVVTEHDVELVHAIEDRVGSTMSEYEHASENKVLERLKEVTDAKRQASLEMIDRGFGERRQKQKEKQLMASGHLGINDSRNKRRKNKGTKSDQKMKKTRN
ncbi:ATP-dependent RNA helicase Dbp8 [Schizosaccharomyces osmophilus]|uniref:ATP-dependent RNA helicase DBP8 n=1 Tax=Schizosaccharomyces osmophilus TaxID=2545709 RepID=A0AAF0AVU4_9SCHI|nr:ATP-dependent RNA helicase Dbp8 [Schizosaccharomyces osmophilus]WBW73951.1 ATP-dependent RNA helicase Dbp8 [Schizosaccharomyces osmophilus]